MLMVLVTNCSYGETSSDNESILSKQLWPSVCGWWSWISGGAESDGQKKSEMSDLAPEGILLEQFNGQKRKRASSEFWVLSSAQAGEQKRQKLDPEVQPTSGQKKKKACSQFEEAGEKKRVRLDLQEHTKQLEKVPIGANSFKHSGGQKRTRLANLPRKTLPS